MSALKVIKFVLETQGCSLDFGMVFILKGMFLTYPRGVVSNQGIQNETLKHDTSKNLEDSPNVKQSSASKAADLKTET